MLRGAKKNMIVIRTRDSRMFEEAYFVMRRDTGVSVNEADMLFEANRILENASPRADSRPSEAKSAHHTGFWRGALWFGAGLLSGGGGIGLLWLLL